MLGPRGLARYALDLAIIGVAYFVLAKVGSTLVSIHLIAVPIWPATGLALAAVLLRGLRVWPAIFIAALAAGAPTDNATFAGSLLTSAGVAAGQTLAALVGGYLVSTWSDGRGTFDTPTGVAKFAAVSVGPSAMIGATVGVASFSLAGHTDDAVSLWGTWWLRDAAGALVIAPVVVLWAISNVRSFNQDKILASAARMRCREPRGPGRLQPVHRAERLSELVGVPRRPAAVVGRATLRPARHRDRRAHSFVLCGLGHLGG